MSDKTHQSTKRENSTADLGQYRGQQPLYACSDEEEFYHTDSECLDQSETKNQIMSKCPFITGRGKTALSAFLPSSFKVKKLGLCDH